MIFLVVGFFVRLYSLKQMKKAFLCFLVFKVFLVTNINVLSIPGLPLLSLDMCLTLWFFFWIFKRRKSELYCRKKMPYMKPMFCIAFVYFLSTLFSIAGFGSAVSAYIKDVCNMILTPWMMWKLVDSEDDFRFVIKGLMIAFLLTCVYGIVERVIQANPLVAYETTLVNDMAKTIDFRYEDEFRGYRVQSVFEHPIGAGINWAMFAFLVLIILWERKETYIGVRKALCMIVFLLCLLCLLFSNCRGPIVFFIVSLFAVVNFKSKRSLCVMFFLALMGVAMLSAVGDNYVYNILSLFDDSYQDKVGGSTAEQRMGQLNAAIALLKQSPLWGLGYKFLNVMSNSTTRALLGLESMWFRILVQFGLLGFLANVYLGIYSLFFIPRKYRIKTIFWFSLAYWVTASLTSLPGMLFYLYYFIIFYLIKQKGCANECGC